MAEKKIVWGLTDEEMKRAEDRYLEGASSADYIRLGRGHYEDITPSIAKAQLQKVALVFQEHAAVKLDPADMISLPLGLIHSLFVEAGLIQEGINAKAD